VGGSTDWTDALQEMESTWNDVNNGPLSYSWQRLDQRCSSHRGTLYISGLATRFAKPLPFCIICSIRRQFMVSKPIFEDEPARREAGTLISLIRSASGPDYAFLVEKAATFQSDCKGCRPVGFALNIGFGCKGWVCLRACLYLLSGLIIRVAIFQVFQPRRSQKQHSVCFRKANG
jgi:hypothetical protein